MPFIDPRTHTKPEPPFGGDFVSETAGRSTGGGSTGGAPEGGGLPRRHKHHHHHHKHPYTHKGTIPPPLLNYDYINFRGYGTNRRDGFAVLCGDTPPTIEGGYAKWKIVDRPLMTGATVFEGYDPVTMKLSLRFGAWDHRGWHIDEKTGLWLESEIEKLEWMAGARIGAGQSPIVYVNTYGPKGATTNLIPYEYQTTVGAHTGRRDTYLWPWVIGNGIQWGQSWRSHAGGSRIYQEATVVLTQFAGFSKPPEKHENGHWFEVTKRRDDCLLIAGAPKFAAINVQGLAEGIRHSPHNNPIHGTKIKLKDHHMRWKIPLHKKVWVPAHTA